MVDKTKSPGYDAISPGTIGVSQRTYVSYFGGENASEGKDSGLVFLAKNDVMACGQNQY